MIDGKTRSKAEGEREALLYIIQIAVGAAAWLLVASVARQRLLGDLLGFVAMCAVQYPFAQKTWAADVPPRRYWMGVLIGTTVAAGLRLVLS